MSSPLSAPAITATTAMTRISVSRCSTLPAHRGSARAEKCSTSFATDIATLPSLIKGEPAQPVSPSEPARPFHASPLRLGRRRRLAGAPGRGTLEKDKPPILGLIQRGGQGVLRLLAHVQQKTIQPIIEAAVAKGTRIHTDEYDIFARLPAWGY